MQTLTVPSPRLTSSARCPRKRCHRACNGREKSCLGLLIEDHDILTIYFGTKVAVTDRAPFIVTLQVVVLPLHASPHAASL
jgi:hypothetical protein